jgi:hypothetical protein
MGPGPEFVGRAAELALLAGLADAAAGHVQHILTKLGLHTRTQIATWSLARDR